MSSRIEDGVVTITAPYSWAEPGRRLFVAGAYAQLSGRERRLRASFDDYLARLAVSSAGHANGVGVSVRADESALLELIEGGLVHASLVEEPEARAA
jgi:hypothetical protein